MDVSILQAASKARLTDRERRYLCNLIAIAEWEREKALYWRRIQAAWLLAAVVLLVAVMAARPFR